MQIKRSIEKIPGGMMLVPLFLGALCHTFSPGAGKYFGSFTNGMITGTVPILAVWFFCMGASIKLSATGTVLRKSGTLVVTKIAVAWVVAAIASRIIPEHGVEVGFFAGLSQYYRSWWALPWGTLTLNCENFSAKRCKR